MIKKSLILLILSCIINLKTQAQFFNLDSIIIEKSLALKLPDVLKKLENKERLPIIASTDLIKVFNLKDTVLNGLKIIFFTSREEMIKAYGLKNNNNDFFVGSIFVKEGSNAKIELRMDFGVFKCDKNYLAGKHVLTSSNAIYLINFIANSCRSSVTVQEISH